MNNDKRTKYIGIFREEAKEHLDNLSLGLLELELKPDDAELIHGLLRAAHTLKGSSKMLGLDHIGNVAHIMEDIFNGIENGALNISPEVVDALLGGTDTIKDIVDSVGSESKPMPDTDEIIRKLQEVFNNAGKTKEEVEPKREHKHKKEEKKHKKEHKKSVDEEAAPPHDEFPRIKADKEGTEYSESKATPEKDDALPYVEKAKPEPIPAAQPDKSKSQEPDKLYGRQERDTIRVDTKKLDDLLNVAGELLINKIKMESHLHRFGQLIDKANRVDTKAGTNGGNAQETITRLTSAFNETRDDLQTLYHEIGESLVELDLFSQDIRAYSMGLRVLPARVLFDEFYRTVRDFARQLKKEIKLEVTGGDTELDKQLIEELRPALIHIIRNSCDHGIESPEVREKSGKPAEGTIQIHAYHKGHNVIVEITDDGAGIDIDRVRQVAVEKGLTTQEAAHEISDIEAAYLIMRPGFSTSKIITDISGRGVGMDVVKTNIERIKGDLIIETEKDKFTKLILTAPLTLSIMNALLVQVREDIYAIPLTYVQETVRLPISAIFTEAGKDAFNLRGDIIPLVKLESMLAYKTLTKINFIPKKIPVVVLKFRNQKLGLIVDHYLRDQEIVVKSLGKFLGEVPYAGGVTVLRYGEPAIILNIFDVFAAAERWAEMGILEQIERAIEEKPELKILVVDDSITTRMMEKSILESAGYNVDLAVSGEEAEEKLNKNKYNLVVTDIEMPGINGFELTRRIRQNDKTKEMPVVVVTSLASDEHKRMGIEVGAQAYIVKGAFDQTTLLDAIKSLID